MSPQPRRPHRVAHLNELEAIPGPGSLTWRPVRAHLGHLYDKFGTVETDGLSKREVLANDAMDRGIITSRDYE